MFKEDNCEQCIKVRDDAFHVRCMKGISVPKIVCSIENERIVCGTCDASQALQYKELQGNGKSFLFGDDFSHQPADQREMINHSVIEDNPPSFIYIYIIQYVADLGPMIQYFLCDWMKTWRPKVNSHTNIHMCLLYDWIKRSHSVVIYHSRRAAYRRFVKRLPHSNINESYDRRPPIVISKCKRQY